MKYEYILQDMICNIFVRGGRDVRNDSRFMLAIWYAVHSAGHMPKWWTFTARVLRGLTLHCAGFLLHVEESSAEFECAPCVSKCAGRCVDFSEVDVRRVWLCRGAAQFP